MSPARPRAESPAAVLYVRVSSADQIDGTSLETQRQACRACAGRLGLRILSEHEDAGKSAKTVVGRDALSAAVDAAAKTGSALIVYKFDRLSRNLGDGYELRDLLIAKGCRIISATEGEASATPVSKAMFAMMMAFSELDNDMRSERCRAGMASRARAGYWTGPAPHGFRLVRKPAGGAVLEPDEHAPALRAAFLSFISGRADKSALLRAVMRTGCPPATASRVIRNPVYGGIIRGTLTGGEDIPAAFPGIITPQQFYLLADRLDCRPCRRSHDNPAFPYTGAIICSECGRPLKSGYSKSRRYGYYFCPRSGHSSIPAQTLHEQILSMLRDLGKLSGFFSLLKRAVCAVDAGDDPALRQAAEKRRSLSRLEPQLIRLRAALLDGTFSPEEYRAEHTRLQSQIAETRQWLTDHTFHRDRREQALDILVTIFSDPETIMQKLTVPRKKELIRILFGSLKITQSKKVELPQSSPYAIFMRLIPQNFGLVDQMKPRLNKWFEAHWKIIDPLADSLSKLMAG